VTDLMTTDLPTPAFGVCAPTAIDDDWRDEGLCAQTDPEAFFPEKGGSTREAKSICRGCDVRHECLWTALEANERFGIWGGLSQRERQSLMRQLPALTSPVRDADALDAISWLYTRISAANLDPSVLENWLATPHLRARLRAAAKASDAEDDAESAAIRRFLNTGASGDAEVDPTERLAS
jgi:hypothetical protein